MPPWFVVPYRFPFESTSKLLGYRPSEVSLGKLCRTTSDHAPPGDCTSWKTVPWPFIPPAFAVPKRFPAESNTNGLGVYPPGPPFRKVCNTVSCQAPLDVGVNSHATPDPARSSKR